MRKHVRWMCALCLLALLCGALPVCAESAPEIETAEKSVAAIELTADQIKKAQRMLIELGYLKGGADGVFGPKSAEAVRAFQADNALEVTGMLDASTREALLSQARDNASAKEIQQRLIDAGYLRGKADGAFGKRSKAALRLFQAIHGLTADGQLNEATLALLYSEDIKVLPSKLASGSKGERVEALQERLIQFGFLEGVADGSYGRQTVNAVRRFQKHLIDQGVDEALGIEANGEATPATLALLMDEGYSSYLRDVAPGDEGLEVLRAEQKLATLGYMDMPADEVFDDYAVRAAHAFQAAAGLDVGPLDRASIDALYALDAPQADQCVPHDIAAGDTGRAVRAAEEALMRYGMLQRLPRGKYDDELREAIARLYDWLSAAGSPSAPLFADDSALSEAAQEVLRTMPVEGAADIDEDADPEQILRLQRRLHTLFYLSRDYIDGKFGERTEKALCAFQKANGLEETGIGDATTRRVLFGADALENRRPYRVEVDISRQRVLVFELNDDGTYTQTHEFICSTGMGNSTPRGIFLDGFPVNNWHHFEKFDCWARYSFLVEGDIMFHSVLFDEDDESTVRENSVYALGSKASHGCIRLHVRDARWLFEHCKRGSLVIIIY